MAYRIEPRALLDQHGTTYAEQAGITLRDKPAPLWQLLVLTMLSSARISADVAAGAARELFGAGWRTPQRLLASTWQQRVDALGRGSYQRFDESTARYLEENARHLVEELGGDLRRLRPGNDGSRDETRGRLEEFARIGPTGSAIFCREVQAVWSEIGPFFDRRALDRARELGYPGDPDELAVLVGPDQVAAFAAALTRSALAR